MADKNNFLGRPFYWLSAIFLTILTVVIFTNKSESVIQMANVSIGPVDVSGLTEEQAQQKVDQYVNDFENKKIQFSLRDQVFEVAAREVGLAINAEKAMRIAKRQEIRPTRLGWASLFQPKESQDSDPQKLSLDVNITMARLQEALQRVIPNLDRPERAAIRFFDPKLADEMKIGYTVDYEKVAGDLKKTVKNSDKKYIALALLPEDREENQNKEAENPLYSEQMIKDADYRAKYLQNQVLDVWISLSADELQRKHYKIPLKDNADWIDQTKINGIVDVNLNAKVLQEYLTKELAPQIDREMSESAIKTLPEAKNGYAKVEGVAKLGIKIKIDESVEAIRKAVSVNNFTIGLVHDYIAGTIKNESGRDLGKLVLLGSGRSNFVGSPEGRVFNINKAVSQHFNNIMIAPGETFAYNSYLGGPVTYEKGWKASLGIFGNSLIPIPGGGVCQVSTTVFRAAVMAGLPIPEKSNHSLYVSYYKEFGEGIDAAVYPPGNRDLRFVNDTGNYILMQSYVEGTDVVVNIFGVDDGRRVGIKGPYRVGELPLQVLSGKRAYNKRQIIWFQTIKRANSSSIEQEIVSTYRDPVPRRR